MGEARVEEFEEILAYHLERAHRLLSELGPLDEAGRELGLRAARHYAASARRASDRSDDRAAATLFRHAADLLPEGHPDRPRALYDVGRASLRGLDPPVAFAALDEAVAAAAASGQRSIEWMARIDRGLVQMMVDPIGFTSDDLRAEVAAARAELEAGGDDEALAVVWLGLVQVEWNPCRFDAAREAAIHAVEHARRTGDRSLVMDAMTLRLATELLGSTSPAEGWPSLEAAVAELGRDGLIGHVVLVHEACFDAMTGDFDRARERIREAEALAERFGSALWALASYEFGGHIEEMAGDQEAAARSFREEYELHRRMGDEGHGSTSAAYLAVALCRLGRFDEAEELATIARATGADDDLATQASARSAQALVRSARGEHEEARRLAREAVDLYAGAQSPWFHGDTLMVLVGGLTRGRPARGSGRRGARRVGGVRAQGARAGDGVGAGVDRRSLGGLAQALVAPRPSGWAATKSSPPEEATSAGRVTLGVMLRGRCASIRTTLTASADSTGPRTFGPSLPSDPDSVAPLRAKERLRIAQPVSGGHPVPRRAPRPGMVPSAGRDARLGCDGQHLTMARHRAVEGLQSTALTHFIPGTARQGSRLSRGHHQAEMALPSLDPPPLATLQRAGDDLGGDFCQVLYRPGPGRGGRNRTTPRSSATAAYYR